MIDPITESSDNILNFKSGDDTASLLSNEDIEFINTYQKLDAETRQKFLERDDEVGEKLRNILQDVQKRTQLKQVLEPKEQLPPEDLNQGFQVGAAKTLQGMGELLGSGSQKLRDITPEFLKPFNTPATFTSILSKGYSKAGELLDPTGERKRYQDLGIDPFDGFNIGERAYLGVGATRNYTVDDVQTTLTKTRGQEPYFVGHIIAGDKNSPIVFQMNENDTPQTINTPGFTVEDLAEFGVQDAAPLIPEIATSIVLKNRFFGKGELLEGRGKKAAAFTKTQVAPAFLINGLYEYIRLAVGKEKLGLNKDKTYTDLAQDAGLIAGLAGAGEGVFGVVSTGLRSLHGFLSEGKVPNEILNDLNNIVKTAGLKISREEVIDEAPAGFKPTFGQRTKDADLLELESVFLGSSITNKEVRQRYLSQLEDNNRAIADYVKNLLTVEGNTLSSREILEKIAPEIQTLSRDRINLLEGVINKELQEELTRARNIRGAYNQQRGNAFEVGRTLFGREAVDPTQTKIPGTFDNYIFDTARSFKEEVDNVYNNVLNPAINNIPAKPENFREVLLKLDKANNKGAANLIASLANPNLRRELGLEGDAFGDFLLRLGDRNSKGQFKNAADGMKIGELRSTKEGLDYLIKNTDSPSTKASLLKLGEAIQNDIDKALGANKFDSPITIEGQLFDNPLSAKNYVDNLYQQANENFRSQVLQDFRTGRFDYASFFDYLARQDGKSYQSMGAIDEIFQILDKGSQDFIPAFREGVFERLRNATENITDKGQAKKIVKDFFEDNSALANRIFTPDEIRKIKGNFNRSLGLEIAAREKADLARGTLKAQFGDLIKDDTAEVGNLVYRLLIDSPDKIPTVKKRELINIIKDNPVLEKEVQNFLMKDLSEKLTIKDTFYGNTFNPATLNKLTKDVNFNKTYGDFLGREYVTNLKLINNFINLQERALGNSFRGEGLDLAINKGTARDIINFYGKQYSEGQQLAQFILGPLNKYSVKFRIASSDSLARGFDTVTKLVENPVLLNEFVKNRFKRTSKIRRDSILGGFLAKQFFAEDEPEKLTTEEITLLPKQR